MERVAPSFIPEKPTLAFWPGERLEYEVSYLGVPSGHAVMEVVGKTQMKGREVFHVVSTVRSNGFVDLFYRVRDRVETFIDVESQYSHAIKIKQRQGKKKRDRAIDFDQVRHRAVLFKKSKVETFLVPPNVQDALSSLYYFRSQYPLEVGNSTFIPVHASKKNWELEVQILSREEITTPLGTFKTVKAKALSRFEGVFMDKGDVTIWLTDDSRHIPIMIESEIKIGSISILLSSAGDDLVPPTQTKALISQIDSQPL